MLEVIGALAITSILGWVTLAVTGNIWFYYMVGGHWGFWETVMAGMSVLVLAAFWFGWVLVIGSRISVSIG